MKRWFGVHVARVLFALGIGIYLEKLLLTAKQQSARIFTEKEEYESGLYTFISQSKATNGSSSGKIPAAALDTVQVNPVATTTSSDQLKQQQRRRPILYLHPGPAKTATTTIQRGLTHYQRILQEQDNILFLGKEYPTEKWIRKFPHPSHCLMYQQYSERTVSNKTCFDDFKEQLDGYRKQGTDLIMSCEVIGIQYSQEGKHRTRGQRARETLGMLSETLLLGGWDVRVLIGYRPLFEVLVSSFNQFWKTRLPIPFLKDKLIVDGGSVGVELPEKCADAGKLTSVFEKEFPEVVLFDINQDGDLMEHFLCDLLENATNACRAQKDLLSSSRKDGEVRKNVAVPLDYRRISMAAHDRGLFLVTSSNLNGVATLVKRHIIDDLNATIKDLPLVCVPKQKADALFNASLSQEMKLFPHRRTWETKTLFDAMMKKKGLCEVDIDKLFDDDDWKEFFRSLASRLNWRRQEP